MTVILNSPRVKYEESFRQAEVDIYLVRESNMWHLWENATFQMIFKTLDSSEIDYSKFDVEIDASTSEVITFRNGAPAYSFYAKILHDSQRPDMSRVLLRVLGPDEAIYSKLFESNLELKLCTVILKAKDMSTTLPPVSVEWKEFKGDKVYFQSTAYTYIDSVNTAPDYAVVKDNEDHIEIGWLTKFKENIFPPPPMVPEFEVEYTGNLNSICRYSTLSEYDNAGFVIKRGEWREFYRDDNIEERNAKYDAIPDSVFNVVVGDYRMPEYNSRMRGLIYSHSGKKYVPIPDTLDHRMVNYVYRLYYEKASEQYLDPPLLYPLATRNLLTPNGVITQATASPNPCSERSIIKYTVDDDVYLTCEVFDQNGASVKKLSDDVNGLLDKTYVPRGVYYAVFDAPELAAQGLYDVYFIAYPVNDKSVEISTANVKIQLIRGYSNY